MFGLNFLEPVTFFNGYNLLQIFCKGASKTTCRQTSVEIFPFDDGQVLLDVVYVGFVCFAANRYIIELQDDKHV